MPVSLTRKDCMPLKCCEAHERSVNERGAAPEPAPRAHIRLTVEARNPPVSSERLAPPMFSSPSLTPETIKMTKMKLLGAVAVASTMLAGSAMAQAVVTNPARCSAQFPNANCQNLGPGNPYTDSGTRQRRAAYRQSNGDWNNDWNRS